MHDFYYELLLGDSTNFQPRQGNRYFEIIDSGGTSSYSILEDHIEETRITSWLHNASDRSDGDDQPVLRLLVGAPEEHLSDAGMLPLPVSRSTYESICKRWNLPTELLRMMLSTLPLSVSFETRDAFGHPLKGLMLRGARSRDWNFCLGLVHCPSCRMTCALVNGMQEVEVEKLIHCLKESMQHARDPALVAVFLLEWRVHFFASLLERRAIGIEEIEYSTGMRHGFSRNPKRNQRIERDKDAPSKPLDFDPITQKLTGVTGTLSFCNLVFESSKRTLIAIIAMRGDSGVRLQNASDHKEGTELLSRRLAYLDELISGAQAHGAVLTARTRAQVQTVYSMISQRDADSSRDIAATSLVHNQAMKDISEESRKIAALTRKDSGDMRIIAGVTLVFLPGTFMATMFSSSFFKFLPNNSSKVVSGWIWLYFVLTFVATTIVLLFWWYFSRRQAHYSQKVGQRGCSDDADFPMRRRMSDATEKMSIIRAGSLPA